MKKKLLSILIIGISMVGYAQKNEFQQIPAKINTPAKVIKPVVDASTNRVIVFNEDFSNGFEGNNGVGAWTATDSENNDVWHYVNGDNSMTVDQAGNTIVYPDNYPDIPNGDAVGDNVQSPAGEFTNGSLVIQSTTTTNGWMIFDGDFNSVPYSSTGGINVQGFLTSPVLDFTDDPTVIIEFQQYFIYCCFGNSPMTLDVSNDGGNTWTLFPTNDYFIETANAFSDNVMTTSIDVSCAAGGQSNVMFRFAYNSEFNPGYSHYYWGIDDVTIYSNPHDNDLAIDLVTNGDIYNLFEYRVTPMEQAFPATDGGLLVGTYFQNYGALDQNNVTLTVEILDEDGTVLSTNESGPFDVLSFNNGSTCPNKADSIYIETGWVPETTGIYTIKCSLFADGVTDDVVDNNTYLKTIRFTDVDMGHDEPAVFDVELEQRVTSGIKQPGGFGNMFQFNNAGSEATGIVVYFGPQTAAGSVVQAKLVDATEGLTFAASESPLTFADYDIQPEDVPSSMNAAPIPTYIEFEDAVDLSALTDTESPTYFVAVTVDEGEGLLTVMANANADTDFSTRYVNLNGDQELTWFHRPDVPAVRLAMGTYVGIEKVASLEGVGSLTVSPNPVSDVAMITYNLTSNIELQLEIIDVTGKVVYSTEKQTQMQGQHQLQVDASEYSNGIYFCSLISGNKRITKKLIVRK